MRLGSSFRFQCLQICGDQLLDAFAASYGDDPREVLADRQTKRVRFRENVLKNQFVCSETLANAFERDRFPWVGLPRVCCRSEPTFLFGKKNLVTNLTYLFSGLRCCQFQIQSANLPLDFQLPGEIRWFPAHQELSGNTPTGMLKNRERFGSVVQVVCNQTEMFGVNRAHRSDKANLTLRGRNVTDQRVQDV